MNGKKKTKKISKEEAEVEDLLKSVEDDVLLKLSLNSHMSRVSPNYIDSDLDRRFRALKSQPSSSSSPSPNPKLLPPPNPISAAADPELEAVLGGDLAARFAALRSSVPNSEPVKGFGDKDKEDDEFDEDDEVEKLIRWAKDAARLDPSPPSDDEDFGDADIDQDDRESDDDDDENDLRPAK